MFRRHTLPRLALQLTPGAFAGETPRANRYGDLLLPGAVTRLGTLRLRHEVASWSSSTSRRNCQEAEKFDL